MREILLVKEFHVFMENGISTLLSQKPTQLQMTCDLINAKN
jgi:hypothetical protein